MKNVTLCDVDVLILEILKILKIVKMVLRAVDKRGRFEVPKSV